MVECGRLSQQPCTPPATLPPVIPQVQAGAAHAEARGVSAGDVAAVIWQTLEADRPRTRQVVGTAAAAQMAIRRWGRCAGCYGQGGTPKLAAVDPGAVDFGPGSMSGAAHRSWCSCCCGCVECWLGTRLQLTS